MEPNYRLAHERLCARYPRYAAAAVLKEWTSMRGEQIEYVAVQGSPSVQQVEWIRRKVEEEMDRLQHDSLKNS